MKKCTWLCLGLLIFLTACSANEPPLRVGLLIWPPYEFAFLAQEQGYIDKKRVEIVEYQAPIELFRAYQSGIVDVISVTADFLLQLQTGESKDAHLGIMVIDISHGGDVLMARPGIKNLSQLKGKKIAMEPSSLSAHMFMRMLEKSGLKLADVQRVHVDTPEHVAVYKEQKVDAIITYEPARSKLKSLGANILFDSSQIPGEIIDVLVTRRSTLKKRNKDLQHFIGGWLQGLEYYKNNQQQAITYMAKREGLTPQEMINTLTLVTLPDLEGNRKLLGKNKDSLVDGVEYFASKMNKHTSRLTREELSTMFTDEALPSEH